jgi:hypothetical protein
MSKHDEVLRRDYFINPAFQLRFIGFTLLMALLAVVVVYCSQMYFFWNFAKLGHEIQLGDGHPFFRFLSEQQKVMSRVFWVTALSITLITIVWGILLSHKIAGPILRIDTHIKNCLELKQFEAMKFRKNDLFPELAEHVNDLLFELNRK